MTINSTGWYITCDRDRCDVRLVTGGGIGANVAQVRAAQYGWWVDAKNDRHLCPAHSPKDGPDAIVMVSP